MIAAVVGLSSCARSGGEPAPAERPAEQVIATLHTRDSVLTITSAPAGLRYSLLDAEGETRPDLTLEELEAHDPNLSEVVRSAIATRGGQGLDARVLPLGADRTPPRPGR